MGGSRKGFQTGVAPHAVEYTSTPRTCGLRERKSTSCWAAGASPPADSSSSAGLPNACGPCCARHGLLLQGVCSTRERCCIAPIQKGTGRGSPGQGSCGGLAAGTGRASPPQPGTHSRSVGRRRPWWGTKGRRGLPSREGKTQRCMLALQAERGPDWDEDGSSSLQKGMKTCRREDVWKPCTPQQ